MVMVGKIEKVNLKIAKCTYAFNGLSFNVDDVETVTLVHEFIGIPLLLFYVVLVFSSEFVVLFA